MLIGVRQRTPADGARVYIYIYMYMYVCVCRWVGGCGVQRKVKSACASMDALACWAYLRPLRVAERAERRRAKERLRLGAGGAGKGEGEGGAGADERAVELGEIKS